MIKKRGKNLVPKMPKLKRELGLFETTLAGVGIILGAGIYVLIGAATAMTGNSVWISFLLAAVLAMFTGLSYAELSSMFPRDSGEYVYAEKAFGKRLAFIVGYFVILTGIISAAAVALGFAGYFTSLFNLPATALTFTIIAIVMIALFSFINFYGIKQSAYVNIVCTLLEVAGLLLIIGIAFKYMGNGINYMDMPFGKKGIFGAAALIFFAFIGFESIIKLSEETRNPKKTIPKALILSIIITTVLYIATAIAAINVIGWEKLAASSAPLADVAAFALGSNAFLLLAIIALFSTANTVLIILVTTSRMLYGMGQNHSAPKFFSKVHSGRMTPWIAIVFVMILSMLFALFGDIGSVAGITNFAIFVTFAVINLAVIWIRYKHPHKKREFKIPLNIGRFPVLAILGAVFSVFMLSNLERNVLYWGIGLIVFGIFVYESVMKFNHRRKR